MNNIWKVIRLKSDTQILFSNIDKKKYDNEEHVLLCNYTDVYKNDVIHSNIEFMAATASINQIKKLTLKYNDVIITKDSETANDIAIPAIVKHTQKDLVCGYHLAIIRSKKLFGGFINYLFKSILVKEYCMEVCVGITRVSLGKFDLSNFKFSKPPLYKQIAIANYLDHHTSKIDKEIFLLEQKVALMDEYKQALIYETVTKGLDKNVPMKDSGIDWIGEIPEHWEVKRVLNFFSSPKTITVIGRKDVLSLTLNGVIEKNIESNKGLSPVSYDTYQVFKKDDLVFKLIDLANYQTSRVGKVWKNGIMSSAYIRLSKKKKTNFDYFYYQFFDLYKRAVFNMLGGNGVRSAINRGDLLKLCVVSPLLDEQKLIANYLVIIISNIDNKKELLNKKIALLQEYKQSLIYEVVTGKVQVGEIL